MAGFKKPSRSVGRLFVKEKYQTSVSYRLRFLEEEEERVDDPEEDDRVLVPLLLPELLEGLTLEGVLLGGGVLREGVRLGLLTRGVALREGCRLGAEYSGLFLWAGRACGRCCGWLGRAWEPEGARPGLLYC